MDSAWNESCTHGSVVAKTLYGKGIFTWQLPHCEGGDPGAIAARARAADLTHVLIKIADTVYEFGIDRYNRDLNPPVVAALRGQGIDVWGWHYVKGDDPVREAQVAVRRVQSLGLDGYVIDAEVEYKQAGKANAARAFMEALRAGLPDTPIALSSFRFPSYHPELPWSAFLEKCDYNMPQVYWVQAHNSDAQLARSAQEFSRLTPSRPVVPTGSAYGENGWRATADDLQRFFQKAVELGLTAASAYSWDWAGAPGNEDLWNAIAGFQWPAPPRPEIAELLVSALNGGDAAEAAGLYHENAAHVTAAQTLSGRSAIAGWYRHLLGRLLPGARFELTGHSGEGSSRHFTWTAAGPTGTVLDGNDTLGLRDGKIQYHYTYFNARRP